MPFGMAMVRRRPHRRRIDVRVGAGDHHRPSRARVLVSLELSRRKEVGEDAARKMQTTRRVSEWGKRNRVIGSVRAGDSVD